jgi:hypothetical protein
MKAMESNGKAERRSCKGTALAEFGPALWILMIGFFGPMVDVMSIAIIYGSGFTLNNLQAQQAAYSRYSEVAAKTDAVKKQWKDTGLGKFCNLTTDPETKITLVKGQAIPGQEKAENNQDYLVQVTTTVTCRPFLTIPVGGPIPGLSAPMQFTFVSERVLENPDDANS